jgi:hypothetical protein
LTCRIPGSVIAASAMQPSQSLYVSELSRRGLARRRARLRRRSLARRLLLLLASASALAIALLERAAA